MSKRDGLDDLLLDLMDFRDRLLRAIGREESVQDREELRARIVECISDSTEVMIGEVLDRYLRAQFGLADDPSAGGSEDEDDHRL